MSGLRSSRNLLAPPTVIRAGNPECPPYFGALGVKRNPTVPHTWLYLFISAFPRGVVVGLYIRIDVGELTQLGCTVLKIKRTE